MYNKSSDCQGVVRAQKPCLKPAGACGRLRCVDDIPGCLVCACLPVRVYHTVKRRKAAGLPVSGPGCRLPSRCVVVGRAAEREGKRGSMVIATNALEATRPVIFCDPENGWNEIIRPADLACHSPLARTWEMASAKRFSGARRWGTTTPCSLASTCSTSTRAGSRVRAEGAHRRRRRRRFIPLGITHQNAG